MYQPRQQPNPVDWELISDISAKYGRGLLNLACRHVQPEDAEELVQTAIARWVAKAPLDARVPPYRFFETTVKHDSKNFYRSRSRRRARESRAAMEHSVTQPQLGAEWASDDIEPEIVQRLLLSLPDEDREILWLKHGLAWTNEQIGTVYSVTGQRISQRLKAIHKLLRRRYESETIRD